MDTELFGSNSLAEESTMPLYHQIMSLLKHQINTGLLKPGDIIPSESELCSTYNVSRSTVRQALNQLVEEGLIIRRRGKGSFVAREKLHRSLNHLYSFTEDMLDMGKKPYSKILEKTIIKASDEIISLLSLKPENAEVFKLTRIRAANDEPLLLETTYIPLYLCPDILEEDFSVSSLYKVLRSRYNLNLHKAVETYEAVKLDRESALLLNCKTGAPAFSIQRIGYLNSGTAFELTTSITRSDKCVFEVELHADKNRVNFSRKINL